MKTERDDNPLTLPEPSLHTTPRSLVEPSFSGRTFVFVIFGLFLIAVVFKIQVFGFSVTGWVWLGGLAAAVATLVNASDAVLLPFQYWIPWAALVLIYTAYGFDYAVQSAAQILCPLLVGMAASTLRPSEDQIETLMKWFRKGVLIFLAVVVFLYLPMLLLGRLPGATGLAPEAMSAMLFQSVFLCSYLFRSNKADLLLYLACAALTVVSLARGTMLGSLALAVFTLAPLGLTRRVFLIAAAAVAGLVIFNMPRVQQKTFWSGQGSITDVKWESRDFKKHGRDLMWERLWSGVKEQPWLGHGGNASGDDLLAAGFPTRLPHNDWLRILFDYGIVGCALYIGAIILQIVHGWRWAAHASPSTRVLLYAAISAFVPYMVVMFTDNILIYVQFYGNLHFLLLGLAYGGLAAETQKTPIPET